jgi:tetratricopeptide (TPR) repeat protein
VLKVLFTVLFILVSLPVFGFRSVVILPFNNDSQTQQIYWLGEGFAESLSEELLLRDLYVIQRPERKAAYDALRLPYVGNLSRATMLKIGEGLAADYVVFGSYNLVGKNLKVQAQVIKTSSSKLSAPIQTAGPLEQLYSVQTGLKGGLKNYFASEKFLPLENKQGSAAVPLHAYELYIKGLLEPSDQEKVNFFQRAIQNYPQYSEAIYRLGLSLFRLGRYREANDQLKKITKNGPFKLHVDFLSGLSSYFMKDLSASIQKWGELARTAPTAEVYNNIGIALLGSNQLDEGTKYLQKAVQLDSGNSDFQFNLAAALFQKGINDEASLHFHEAIDLRPNDYQSYYWLTKTLERQSKAESRQVFEFFHEKLPADQKGKFPEQFPSILELLRPSLAYQVIEERDYSVLARNKFLRQRSDYVKTYQGNARKQLEDDHPDRAMLEIKKGITLAPLDWYLHYLWGLALVGQEKSYEAVPHLQFSIWCTDNVDSHMLLAEIYRDNEQYSAAKKQIQQLLTLDPKHKRALELWSKLSNKS